MAPWFETVLEIGDADDLDPDELCRGFAMCIGAACQALIIMHERNPAAADTLCQSAVAFMQEAARGGPHINEIVSLQ
jgi:hypothetical protein